MENKICIKCKNQKDISCFIFRKDTNKYRNQCRECTNKREKELKKSKFENYEWQDYPEKLKCSMCNELKTINCFPKRKDTSLGVRLNCKSCSKEYHLTYEKNRRKNDCNFRLTVNLRSQVISAFKAQNARKTNKTMELLNCSHSFFIKWIEYHLYGEMTMENYGKKWQIDHCLPCSSFNILDENEMKKCFNWKT